eukprot:366053_1
MLSDTRSYDEKLVSLYILNRSHDCFSMSQFLYPNLLQFIVCDIFNCTDFIKSILNKQIKIFFIHRLIPIHLTIKPLFNPSMFITNSFTLSVLSIIIRISNRLFISRWC